MKRENKGHPPRTDKLVRLWFSDGTMYESENPANYDWSFSDDPVITHYEIIQPAKEKKPDTRPEFTQGEQLPEHTRRELLRGKRYVITAAQNNVSVHQGFFDSLKFYCQENDAELLVSTFTYNLNGFAMPKDGDEKVWFDPQILPFLCDVDKKFMHASLVFCGKMNILPTAKRPLSGLEALTGKHSCIVPHASQQMVSVPTLKSEHCKMMFTTGALTNRAYIQRKAGQLADSVFHCLGAVVVEITDDGLFFVRQIQADEITGNFHDLNYRWSAQDYERVPVPVAVLGDIHAERTQWDMHIECVLPMLEALQVEQVCIHDLLDFSTLNHHSRRSVAHIRAQEGRSVEDDFKDATRFLNLFADMEIKLNIVESNHDTAINTLLEDTAYQWWNQPENQRFYFTCQLEKLQRPDVNLLQFCLEQFTDLQVVPDFWRIDESHEVNGVELGMHGHLAPNGARGSPMALERCNKLAITGHTHTAGLYCNVMVVGHSSNPDLMTYAKGPSSWSHTHALLYADGSRTLITMCRDSAGQWKWRAC